MYFFRKYCRQKPNIRWWVMYGLFCPSVINYMISGKIQTDRSPVIWYKYVSIIFCIRVCIIGSNIPNTIIILNITHLYIYHFLVPSGAPQKINCQSRSPNSILLEWSKPEREERNGIIRGYWLQYYPRTLWYGT